MNKEQHESFLADSVRSQLDFYKQLEDMLVPALFNRNITYVMTLSNRLSYLIDGIIYSISNYVQDKSGSKSSIEVMDSWKEWMNRFIVTNYEYYIEHFKSHSEFIAQTYFSNTLNANNLAKTNTQDEKLIFSNNNSNTSDEQQQQQIQRVSIIRRIEPTA
jgi:hypothetical protein